jgi:OmpA-OmpF porin, OOP family
VIGSKNILFILLIINSFIFTALSQPDIKFIPLKKLEKMAANALERNDVYTAIQYYQAYCDRDTNNLIVVVKLADLYRQTRDYIKAAYYYKEAFDRGQDQQIVALFWYGVMLKQQGEYSQAQNILLDFKKRYRGRDLAKVTDNHLDGIKLVQKFKENPQNVDVQHLNNTINKNHIEFSPAYIDKNTIIYGSLSTDTMPYYLPNAEKVIIPLRKLYTAKRVKDLQWENTGVFEGPFNSTDAHTGNGVFSLDGNRFYFSRCKMDWQNNVKCDIYSSQKTDSGWSEPARLPFPVNTEETSSTMPAIGTEPRRGKEVLYFASNRAMRSEGGYDIWYSVFDDKDSTFKAVDNLGRKINTPGNEITPFYDNTSKTLYFSSDYLPGLGGYDIFKSNGDQRRWTNPINMGPPFNSPADDLYYVVNMRQKEEGFFVSNRKGGNNIYHSTCCDDIYSFYNKDYISLTVTAEVIDGGTEKNPNLNNEPLSNVIVILYLPVKDDEGEALMFIDSDTTDANGLANLDLEKDKDYRVMFKKDGYFYKQLSVSTFNKTRSENIKLPKLSMEEITLDPIVFYIYYEFDKDELTPGAMQVIDTTMYKVLAETPDIIVEISAHTDSKGDSLYNIHLSQRRAEQVVKYLVSKGIEPARLIAKGYGEDNPIADNETEEGQAMNRRTEFRIVGSKDPFSKLNVSRLRIINKEQPKEEPVAPAPAPAKPSGTSTPKPGSTVKPATATPVKPQQPAIVPQPQAQPAATPQPQQTKPQ